MDEWLSFAPASMSDTISGRGMNTMTQLPRRVYSVYGGRETSEVGGSESRRVTVPLPAHLCLSLLDLRLRNSL